jgi:hypothetical protein
VENIEAGHPHTALRHFATKNANVQVLYVNSGHLQTRSNNNTAKVVKKTEQRGQDAAGWSVEGASTM